MIPLKSKKCKIFQCFETPESMKLKALNGSIATKLINFKYVITLCGEIVEHKSTWRNAVISSSSLDQTYRSLPMGISGKEARGLNSFSSHFALPRKNVRTTYNNFWCSRKCHEKILELCFSYVNILNSCLKLTYNH